MASTIIGALMGLIFGLLGTALMALLLDLRFSVPTYTTMFRWPAILSIDGEARQVLEQADAGVFVEPEEADQIARAILQLKDEPGRLRRYQQNGPRFVEMNYSRQQLAARLEELLLAVL